MHGWQGNGPGHWQTLLADHLRAAGEAVRYPALPDADTPSAHAWAEVLHAELAAMEGERVVVCHSLGCMLWAHEAARIGTHPVDRVLLVGPICPMTKLPGVRDFFPTPLDAAAVGSSARELLVVSGDDDPYCPAGVVRTYARPLGLEAVVLPGAGHVNVESGYGEWPEVVAWCLEGGGAGVFAAAADQGAKKGVET